MLQLEEMKKKTVEDRKIAQGEDTKNILDEAMKKLSVEELKRTVSDEVDQPPPTKDTQVIVRVSKLTD